MEARKFTELRFRITGVVPLLMHNGQMADPLNPLARKLKEVTSKRNKTIADYEAMARLEWYGSLYVQDDQVIIPGVNLERMMLDSARKRRKGKLVEAGLFCPEEYPLIYDGPTDIDELWESGDYRFTVSVKLKGGRVIRTRAIFRDWALEFGVVFDPRLLNEGEVVNFLEYAGDYIGLGDWRPRHGRFTVEKL